jgi:hypothetical protein
VKETEKYHTFTSANFFPWPFFPGMDRKRLLLRDRHLNPHCSGSSINLDLPTRGDALHGSCDPNDRSWLLEISVLEYAVSRRYIGVYELEKVAGCV